MGTTEHSKQGLMRARWDPREVERNLRRDWVLSRDEGRRLAVCCNEGVLMPSGFWLVDGAETVTKTGAG